MGRGSFGEEASFCRVGYHLFKQKKGWFGSQTSSTLNRALLCKWNWLFANERETLWKHVIGRKFGEEEGGWSTREVRNGFGVGFWKEIRKEQSLLQNKVVFFVAGGRRVRFWKDKWYENNFQNDCTFRIKLSWECRIYSLLPQFYFF